MMALKEDYRSIVVINIRAEFREEGFKSWIQT